MLYVDFLLFLLAILNPSPFFPSKFPFGMRQSSKIRLHVELARIPNLSSFFPNDKPSLGFLTINALIPLCFNDLSVVAKTTAAFAS